MSRRRSHSVFIGLRETAGYCANLKRGFDDLGVRAVFVDLYGHPFAYGQVGSGPWIGRVAGRLRRRRVEATAWAPFWILLDRAAMVALFVWATIHHDTFVFCSGSSFLGLRDLPVLKRLGKRVIHVFFGTDTRPSYLNGYELSGDETESLSRAVAASAAKRRMLDRIEPYADEIVCHTLSAHLHRRPVIAFLALGIPYPVPPSPESPPPSVNRPVRVLHAPSHPEGKGTPRIRAALARVRDEGIDLDAVEVAGQTNAVVLAELARCDFVVDELYSDTAMASFATEAAAFGKPAIVGGYGWEELARTTSPENMPPAHLCHPDDLEAAIRRLATDAPYRQELGQAARAFVVSRWSPAEVAKRYVRLIDGDAVDAWRFDPGQVRYVHGTGIAEERLRGFIRALLATSGRAGLQVGDKPDLEERLAAFAAGA